MSTDAGYEQWLKIQQVLIDGQKKMLGRSKAAELPEIELLAEGIVKKLGVTAPKGSQEFRNLCTELLKASIKADSISLEHLKGNFDTDYDLEQRQRKAGKTLKELIGLYQAEKAPAWADPASTRAIHNRILHILGNVPLSEIDREMCVQFRDNLKDYPLKNSDFQTPWRVLSAKRKSRLSERTQSGTISELSTLFDYANANNYGIKGNPAKNLLKSKEDCAPVKVREPYTVEELGRMIEALAKVNRTKKPEAFWIPLLALYTGARSNEICMLRCADIVQEGDNWFIQFRNVAEHHQRTKNGEDRRAPVHPHLTSIGLIEYLHQQQQAGKDRLFSNLKLVAGKWNVDYGKQYNRTFKKKFLQGYTPDQLSSKDLHTFRKTFIGWFVKSGKVNDMLTCETLRGIVGHFDDSEASAITKYLQTVKLTLQCYGGGFETDPVAFMKQLDYGIDFSGLVI